MRADASDEDDEESDSDVARDTIVSFSFALQNCQFAVDFKGGVDVLQQELNRILDAAKLRMSGGRGFRVSDGALLCTYDRKPGSMVALGEGHYLSIGDTGCLTEFSLSFTCGSSEFIDGPQLSADEVPTDER